MTDRTVFTPEAEEQLVELYRYISATGSPAAAAGYTNSIVAFCEELATFPRLGKARDDIRPGLRTIGFQRRCWSHSARWRCKSSSQQRRFR